MAKLKLKKPKVSVVHPQDTKQPTMKWVNALERTPECKTLKKVSDTKSSKRVLVRWKFKNSKSKWRYSFGVFHETQKNICGPWWSVEGTHGIVQVSHWAYIKKPII